MPGTACDRAGRGEARGEAGTLLRFFAPQILSHQLKPRAVLLLPRGGDGPHGAPAPAVPRQWSRRRYLCSLVHVCSLPLIKQISRSYQELPKRAESTLISNQKDWLERE